MYYINAGRDIEGVAIATTLAMAAHFHIIYFAAASQLRPKIEVLGGYLKMMGRFLFMLVTLTALQTFVTLPNNILTGLARTALLLAVYAFPLWRLEKKFNFLNIIFKKRTVEEQS